MGRMQNGCASTSSSEELSYSKLEYILVKMGLCKQGLLYKGSRILELSWIFNNIIKYHYQNLWSFAFLCKLRLLLFKPRWDIQIKT